MDVTDYDLPPGWSVEIIDDDLVMHGTDAIYRDGESVGADEIEELAWCAWLRDLTEMPDPVPAASVRWLCLRYADRAAQRRGRGDAGATRGRPSLGQSAAARALHVDGRTLRRWVAGDAPMPWSAAELLRRLGS